ncbi:type IV secretion system DNA-binding domain-containing protein [Candidatus Saccharibacteria bacterium]|nr:type IV secretion system DNA-binding domain-containing protein [Candidatus Saccharibacteria bacterium]
MVKTNNQLEWAEIHWPRPLGVESVLALLTHLATVSRSSQVVFEARARKHKVHYLIGSEQVQLGSIQKMMHGELAGLRFTKEAVRAKVTVARSVRLSHPTLAINASNQTAVARAVLAALIQAKHGDDESVLQIVLGQSLTPSLLPDKVDDPTASWLDIIRGSVPAAGHDAQKIIKDKAASHSFAALLRIGASAPTIDAASNQVRSIYSALKMVESVGVRLRSAHENPQRLYDTKRPWIWPMRLSIRELTGVLSWPIGEEELPGVPGLHPRLLLPPSWYKESERSFGLASGFAGSRQKLGIPIRDSLEHTILLGPTGSGKSTAMLNLIMADINANRSVLVIDPKHELVNDVLARVPQSRIDDVVVIDPTDANPVGLNPLVDKARNPSLVADSVLAVFRDVFRDSWGIRTQDILSAALLTLIQYGQQNDGRVSLIWLPILLTDAGFRRKIVGSVAASDPVGLGAFWNSFEAMSVAQRSQHVAPVMNKLRQFLLRPQLRAVLGQMQPKFSLGDVFTASSHKIVLVPLNKGVIGAEAARLLGSLIVGQLWTLALGRASLPVEKRHPVSVFIDEVQDYLSLPTDLADALSQARGLGVGLTLAHQYRAQLPPALRAGIDANARNKVVFGLNSNDAKEIAMMAEDSGLVALDFQLLPRFGVYANLRHNGRSTGWMSGMSSPPPKPTISAAEVKAASQTRYGQSTETMERDFAELLGGGSKPAGVTTTVTNSPIGRRSRRQS